MLKCVACAQRHIVPRHWQSFSCTLLFDAIGRRHMMLEVVNGQDIIGQTTKDVVATRTMIIAYYRRGAYVLDLWLSVLCMRSKA